MKKVLAIVLALVMAFSCASVAFAFNPAEGQIYLGPVGDIEANPGDVASIPIEFVSRRSADALEGVKEDGMLTVPFQIVSRDAITGPIAELTINEEEGTVNGTFELTAEAKKENVKIDFIVGETNGDADNPKTQMVLGTVTLPAKYLFNQQSITLFYVKIAIGEDWPVENYKEEYPLGIFTYAGTDVDRSYVTNPDGEEIDIDGIGSADALGTIRAMPYQPTFFERVWEWIKAKIRLLIDLDNTIDNLLYKEVFNPADWYDEYIARKNSDKAIEEVVEEA